MTNGIEARFRGLSRKSLWRPAGAIHLDFTAHHPQGMVHIGDEFIVATVEIIEPTRPHADPIAGRDRSPGRGVGHLLRIDASGRLIARSVIGEGDIYHPGGFDFDGRWLWLPVAEYRPGGRSILYRIDPASLEAVELVRVDDHVGALVHDEAMGRLVGMNWGSRSYLSWSLAGDNVAADQLRPHYSPNGNHMIDYQDVQYLGDHYMLASGLADVELPDQSVVQIGAVDLVDLRQLRAEHQVPVHSWVRPQVAMTRNPMCCEVMGEGLRFHFLPDDGRTTIYAFDVT